MGIAKKALRNSFPPGSPWTLKGAFGSLVDAIGNVLDKHKTYAHGTVTESLPGTAEDTLREWYAQLGLLYDSTRSIESLQQRANQQWSSAGRQDKDYLEAQLQKAFPDTEIQEIKYNTDNMVGHGMVGKMQVTDGYPAWLSFRPTDGSFASFDFRVVGSVSTNGDFKAMRNLIQRIKPATHRVTYDIEILNQTATSEVGLGMVGLAQVGRTKDNA